MATVARSPHPPVWCVWLLILTAMWMSIVPAAANALPRIADFDLSSDARPEGLRIYLYAHADPLTFSDPSGLQSILIATLTNYAIKTVAYAAAVVPTVATGVRAISRLNGARIEQFLRAIQGSAIAGSQRIVQLTAQANRLYPRLVGKFEEHHFVPKQLVKRLLERGIQLPVELTSKTVQLEASYHRLITNAILARFPRGAKVFDKVKPTLDDVLRELEKIYDDLPLK